jgi:hypothetical protein
MALPMPGDGDGRTGEAIGDVNGRGAAGAGAGAAGLGAADFAAARLRAGALRAGFRAAFLAVLRAGDFLAAARFAVFLFAPILFAAVLRAPVFLAPALFFLLVVRFFPLFFVAMACAPILLCCRTRPLKRTPTCTNQYQDSPCAGLPSHGTSQSFFSLYDDRPPKWQFGVPVRNNVNATIVETAPGGAQKFQILGPVTLPTGFRPGCEE